MALVGSTNEEKIWNHLSANIKNDIGVAALMGNLYAESGLIPNNLENLYEQRLGYTDSSYTSAVDSGMYSNFVTDRAGYGLAQWTYHTRKKSLLEFAKQRGVSIGDLEMQLDFLIQELKGNFASVWNTLTNATELQSASNVVLSKYENPAIQNVQVQILRATYGQKFYNKYAKQSQSKEGATMGKCSAAQAVEAMAYWVGYYEKASSKYATYRDKQYFALDKGSANYTYHGYLCGIQGGAWCAMTVSTAIYEACGNSKTDAKAIMHGIWPYSACNQVYDAAPAAYKGRRGSWTPIPGDIIVFSSNGSTREHTGMVEKVDGTYVYTIEGNKSNMCKRCTYRLTDSYIYGYIRPLYSDAKSSGNSQSSGGTTTLRKGSTGTNVVTLQSRLISLGYSCGSAGADGDFGTATLSAVKLFQQANGLEVDGVVGAKTWAALNGSSAVKYTTGTTSTSSSTDVSAYPIVRYGSKNSYVKTLQKMLNDKGYNCGTVDGQFGQKTLAAVKAFQKNNGLTVDGVVGRMTWAALDR